jgi:hypothetical protein
MPLLVRRLERLGWSLTLALVIVLMLSEKASAQFPGYGWGDGYPGWGYGYPIVGVGYPGLGYGYPGWGYAWGPYAYGGFGYGYPGFGGVYPAPAYAPGYPGIAYAPGYWGLYTPGLDNPLFGAGLTPLGVQSYMFETRLLGRVPRVSSGYYGSGARRYGYPDR